MAITSIKRPKWCQPFIQEPENERYCGSANNIGVPFCALAVAALSALGLSLQLCLLLTDIHWLWVFLPGLAWMLNVVYLLLTRPRCFNLLVFALLLGLATSQCLLLIKLWQPTSDLRLRLVMGILASLALGILIILNMPMRHPGWSRFGISKTYSDPNNKYRSPEDDITFWQWMSISWVSPLLKAARKRMLNEDDVWLLPYEFQHHFLADAFRRLQGSVLRRLLVANWVDLAVLSLLEIVETCTKYSEPILLQELLKAIQRLDIEKRSALLYAGFILLVRVIDAQSKVFSLWYGRRCYERSRGELITMLYDKTLRRKVVSKPKEEKDEHLPEDQVMNRVATAQSTDETTPLLGRKPGRDQPRLLRAIAHIKLLWANFVIAAKGTDNKAQDPADLGRIMNLMRYDSYEVAQRFWECQQLIDRPVGLILSIVLMWRMLGWPAAVGVAVIALSQFLNYLLALVNIRFEKVRRKATDKRLQQTSQYIESIRHLRWYGWQNHWLKNVFKSRRRELNIRLISYIWMLFILFNNIFDSGMVPVATFWAYAVFAKRELSVDIIFPALQVFGMVQDNMSEIPQLIQTLLNAHVAMKRIQNFMDEPDKQDLPNRSDSGATSEHQVRLNDASFAWPGLSQNVLHDLNITFDLGLNVVSGEVGSGKSALLQAILGELDLRGGELVKPLGPIAYCSQTPWLQSMSIRDNILFNAPYEAGRYKETLQSCALLSDLTSFEKGDLSPVGENGIGLSGGQKARVALARAIYSNAAILLLDDPLSALDQQTSEHIVSRCFQGELVKGRTVILVTHRLDLCEPIATRILTIKYGRAEATVREKTNSNSSNGRIDNGHQNERDSSQNITDAKLPDDAVPAKFEEEEHRAHGDIKASVYWQYIKAGSLGWWLATILGTVLSRFILIFASWYLKELGEAYERTDVSSLQIQAHDPIFSVAEYQPTFLKKFFSSLPNPAMNIRPWLLCLFVLHAIETSALVFTHGATMATRYLAGKNLFKAVMQRVSNTFFRYYDVTPTGRLMNRLTSDIGQIDSGIGWDIFSVIWYSITWVMTIAVIASITPLFLLVCALLSISFVMIFLRYLPASQSLRRLETVSLSPLMTNFGALLAGLATVRAFRAENRFQDRLIKVVDTFQGMDHFYWSVQSWLMYRLTITSALSMMLLTVISIYSNLSAAMTAFMLLNAQKFVAVTQGLCQIYGRLQVNFVSVERIVELLDLDQEPSNPVPPPAWWPSYGGSVVFENVTIRYAPHLEPALVDISFELKGGTNTAIVGRTGSGKSTLAAALLATVPVEKGRILIDGIDLATVDRQALRSRVTFLAQEPMLFEGTLRHNLDPTGQHGDAECESVVKRCCGSFGWTLTTPIETGGKNLSQGQRQLVGLARAIMRRSSIIIMDEATASIDVETAWEIQRVLREELQRSTVITIAHRTAAVRDADNAIVLSNGKLESFEPAHEAISAVPDDESN